MATRDDNRGVKPPHLNTPSSPEEGLSEAAPRASRSERQLQVPELLLRNLAWRLRLSRIMLNTAAGALLHQNADADADIAFMLQKGVVDGLSSQLENVNRVLGVDEGGT